MDHDKWKSPRQSRDGHLPRWGSWCWFRIVTLLASTSLLTASTSLPTAFTSLLTASTSLLTTSTSLLTASTSLLTAFTSLLRSNLGATSRSFDWTGWTTRYVNRLIPPKTGREILWFCSRRQLSEVVGQPTSLRASSSIHLCRREMYTCKRKVPKMCLSNSVQISLAEY